MKMTLPYHLDGRSLSWTQKTIPARRQLHVQVNPCRSFRFLAMIPVSMHVRDRTLVRMQESRISLKVCIVPGCSIRLPRPGTLKRQNRYRPVIPG